MNYNPLNFVFNKTGYGTLSFNYTLDSKTDWTIVIALESQPSWDYSNTLAWKILNLTSTTILKLDEFGNLAIAGNLYENTNTPPPNILYKVANVFWLTATGDLYLVKELMELIT